MNILNLFIFSLALWRVASLLVRERGFLDIFVRFRKLLGITHDDDGKPIGSPETNLARLFSCVWCTSMFLAIFYGILIYLWQAVMFWLSLPFALSALAILMEAEITEQT